MSERNAPPAVRNAMEPLWRIYPAACQRLLDAPPQARRRELLALLSVGLEEANAASAWGYIAEIGLFETAIDTLAKADDATVCGWDLTNPRLPPPSAPAPVPPATPEALRRALELVRGTVSGGFALDRIDQLSGAPRRNGLLALLEEYSALVPGVAAWRDKADAAAILGAAIEAVKRMDQGALNRRFGG